MPGRTAPAQAGPGANLRDWPPSREELQVFNYFVYGALRSHQRKALPPGGSSPTPANAAAPAAGWHIRRSQTAASLAPRLVAARPGRRPRPRYAARGKQTGLRDRSAVLTRQVQSEDTPPPADGFARLSARSRQMRSLDRTERDRP